MKIVSRTGAHAVSIPDVGTIKAGPDGVFDVPHDAALELLGFPQWAVDDTPPVVEETPVDVVPADHVEPPA